MWSASLGSYWIGGNQFLPYIDGLLLDSSNSSALALELLQSCTKPSICWYILLQYKYSHFIIVAMSWYFVPIHGVLYARSWWYNELECFLLCWPFVRITVWIDFVVSPNMLFKKQLSCWWLKYHESHLISLWYLVGFHFVGIIVIIAHFSNYIVYCCSWKQISWVKL